MLILQLPDTIVNLVREAVRENATGARGLTGRRTNEQTKLPPGQQSDRSDNVHTEA